MRLKLLVSLTAEQAYKLDKIGRKGLASNGYSQDFDYCLDKAIDDFIKKYERFLE